MEGCKASAVSSSNGRETVKAITGLQNTHDQFLNLPQTFWLALGILVESTRKNYAGLFPS